MKSIWKQFRYRLEFLGLRLLAAAVPLLPRRACLLLSTMAGELHYRVDAKTRGVALENLRVCFGEAMDSAARVRIARASYRNFARAMLDLFWCRRLTTETFPRHFHLVGFEQARALQAEHGAVILFELHHGPYEMASLGIGYAGLPMHIVTMDFKNPSLDAVFARARCHSGNTIVNRHQSMLRLLRALHRGHSIGMLPDLALALEHPGDVIEAFGLKIHVTFLHVLLHQRTGKPIVPITSVPHPDGTCTVTAHPPLMFPPDAPRQEVVQACWNFFEPVIRARPDLWLWSYRHWRHKPRETTREYPDYARESGKFERALAGERAVRRPGQKPPPTS